MNIKEIIENNINNLIYHNNVVDFIKENNIEYTENKNGIFVNISIIDEEKLIKLNQCIINTINYEKIKTNIEESQKLKITIPHKKSSDKSPKKNLKLNKNQIDKLNSIK